MEERKDKSTRERLEEIEAGYIQRAEENRKLILELGAAYHRFAKVTTIILLLLTVVMIPTAVASVVVLGQNSDQTRDIQRQRYDFVLSSCQDQNRTHDATISKLDAVVADIKDPVERAKAEANRAGTLAIIEALVPKQDCVALARAATGDEKPTATGTTASG